MGRMRVGKSQVAGEGSARVAGRSASVVRLSFLLVLVLALAYGQASASAIGLSRPGVSEGGTRVGAATSAAARAHELGYSLTPSTTEPYATCGEPKPGHASCMSIIVPQGVVRQSLLGAPNQQGPGSTRPNYEGSGERGGFSPADLRSAYGISSTGGSGQTVAIVDAYDDPNAEADLKTYRSHYGLSECTTANGCFKKVNQKGEEKNYPVAEKEWAVEISLDIDMVSAVCSECHIRLVEATDNETSNLSAAEDEAVALGATEISNSWGSGEFSEETSEDVHFDHPGIPITVSSGDSGYGARYPSASPYVISVGGTTLKKAEGSRGWTESAWQGSGSGCSSYEPKPTWQTDLGCSKRTDADVAAVADPESPVSIYDSYETSKLAGFSSTGWGLVGGTSVASPIVAAIEAHASATVREEGAEALYNGRVFFDVTTGANGGGCGGYLCEAEEGYDGPTGWGTLDGSFISNVGPKVITTPVASITPAGVVLTGYVYTGEEAVSSYHFEFGKTTSYGSSVPVSPVNLGSSYVWKAVSKTLVGLQRETTYHYRLVLTNEQGNTYGQDHTFVATNWAIQKTPPGGNEEGKLQSVSCASAIACVAVGRSEGLLLAEQWNGTQWEFSSPVYPTEYSEDLASVSCLSSTFCTAVGDYYNSVGTQLPLAEQMNGKTWSVQPAPSPSEAKRSYLRGVSCSSSTACMTVGWSEKIEGPPSNSLAERWNGSEWQILTAPSPAGSTETELASISCTSSTACTAVGTYKNSSGPDEPLAERWNGTEWQLQAMATPTGMTRIIVQSVSCSSATACTAVGSFENGSDFADTLAEFWNGSAWQLQTSPNVTGKESWFESVSCTSATACTAVGDTIEKVERFIEQEYGGNQGFAERWNGTEWAVQTMPHADAPGNKAFGVSCLTAQLCTAVGGGEGEELKKSGAPIAERWVVAPTVMTESSSNVTATEANLKATVNPNGSDTHYHFEYDTREYKLGEEAHGTSIPLSEADAGSGSTNIKVSQAITGLKSLTKYYYRVVATNAGGTVYGNDQTFTTRPPAEWRIGGAPLVESAATSWKGKLKLTENETGEVVECEDTAEGPVAPSGAGEVTKMATSGCVSLKACGSPVTVEALHLPWHEELVVSGGATHDVFTGTGHGEPGYNFKCTVAGIKVSVECIAAKFSAGATNGAGGVTATFLSSEKLACNGKAGTGIVEGAQTLEVTRGGKLSAVNATEAAKISEAEWRLGGVALTESAATSWKGKLKLGESETGEAVECEDTAEGSAVPTDVGEVTKWTSSKCVSLKICESSGITMEAVHLPWHAEVITIEGATHYVLTSGGHGEPGYKMGCKVVGLVVTSECTASTLSTSTTNGSSGLTATFLASEKLACNGKARVGTLEGTQTITASKGGKLEAT